jgi:hypothetical protein
VKDKDTAVIYDLDSTLCHTLHRWHLSPMKDPAKTWADYAAACVNDTPLPGTLARMRLDWKHHQVHICSGRDASALQATEEWLAAHDACYDFLRLRGEGDRRPNEVLKVDYVQEVRRAGVDVVLFYEDWGLAAHAIWKQTGVPVLGVNPFYPSESEQQVKSDSLGGGL